MDAAKHAYLLAHPAGHSLSPAIHNAAFSALGLDAVYEAVDVGPALLAGVLRRWRDDAIFLGANVTTPHKRAVLPLLDEVTPAAAAVGAVNTIVPTRGGLVGDNTDVMGFLAALKEVGQDPGVVSLVLGAGGAARAVVHALVSAGSLVMVAARDAHKAADLAAAMSTAGPKVVAVAPSELAAAVSGAQLLVNATTVGMLGGPAEHSVPLGVDVSLLPPGALVYDLVYRPRLTPLLAAARDAGLRTADGLGMLVWQAAGSLRAWTGLEPPVEAMRAAVSS